MNILQNLKKPITPQKNLLTTEISNFNKFAHTTRNKNESNNAYKNKALIKEHVFPSIPRHINSVSTITAKVRLNMANAIKKHSG